ncbi:MAG TPA: hypothetical protein VEA99_19805 [Gemmatimonadaceae bacterium]|nr:hypothetical protein [Gemmatimonadaceae bacterium]
MPITAPFEPSLFADAAFNVVAYLMFLGNFVVAAIGQAVTPRLAAVCRADPIAYRRLVLRLVGYGAALGVAGLAVALVAGDSILRLLYGDRYAGHGALFAWVMLGGAVFYVASLLWYAAVAARRLAAQPFILLVAMAVTTVACVFLVPAHGAIGASWSLTLGFLVRLVGGAFTVMPARSERNRA